MLRPEFMRMNLKPAVEEPRISRMTRVRLFERSRRRQVYGNAV